MAINPLMLPQIIAMGGAAQPMQQPMTPQPMTPQMPQPQQGPDSLAELTRLLGGDLSGSLTSGDKLLALSGLLHSATRSGRRAGLTPEQVIGGLQQRKVAEVQNRLAVEQMRAKMAQEQQANAAWQDYVAKQPETRRAKLAGIVDPQERQKILAAEPRPFQLTKSGGNQFMVFANPDGTTTSVPLSIPRDVETMQINKGDKILIVDKNTNETIREYDVEMNPAQVAANEVAKANLAIRQAEFRRGGGGGGGGGDGKVKTVVYKHPVTGIPTYGKGRLVPGGYVEMASGPFAGRTLVQAKASGGGNEELEKMVAEKLAAKIGR